VGVEGAFGSEPAFVPYLAAGDPSVEASKAYVEALDRGGADVIELGLPFSEPIAEGPTIQGAVARALRAGMTPRRYLGFVRDVDTEAPLVCMTYYNLIYQFRDETERGGPDAFVHAAADAGVEGFVVPDLPVEEAGPMRRACDDAGVDLVSIVAPTTGDGRLRRLLEISSGYVYVQARLGVTGARDDVSGRTAETLARLQQYEAALPKAVGFGIRTGDHAERIVRAGADGVIVGSALVDVVADGHEAGDPVPDVADRLADLADELKTGAVRGRDPGPAEPERN
jgi:tryptophan synthase alpha chain